MRTLGYRSILQLRELSSSQRGSVMAEGEASMLAADRGGATALLCWLASFALSLAFIPSGTVAYAGGLDTFGCHHDREAGGYHYHRGALAGRTFASKAEMLGLFKVQQPVTTGATTASRSDSQNRTVIRVVDGDTVVLDGGERVWLIGVDTPVRHGREGAGCGLSLDASTRREASGVRAPEQRGLNDNHCVARVE